jgi:uncharacterized protein YcaQ
MMGYPAPGQKYCRILAQIDNNTAQIGKIPPLPLNRYHLPCYNQPMISISLTQARRCLLAQQFLFPPSSLAGKEGIVQILQRLGCIQYDPVNIIGRNPDLVLQARINYYKPSMMEEMLYTDRLLWDGWDKMMSIYLAADWPYFSRYRQRMQAELGHDGREAMKITEAVLEAVRQRGPLCSLDLDYKERASWWWGETRLARAALETLYHMGALGISRRTGARRYFDLPERLLAHPVFSAPDPNSSLEEYHDWHMLRRMGGLGLAQMGAGEHWGGIVGMKAGQRQAAQKRLLEKQLIEEVSVEGVPQKQFFIRSQDQAYLATPLQPLPTPIFLAPLDNLLWDRSRLQLLFGFEYVWEIYKPAEKCQFGRYTMPVLYGEHFIARFEPQLERKSRKFRVKGWWWEENIPKDKTLLQALSAALEQFAISCGASLESEPNY